MNLKSMKLGQTIVVAEDEHDLAEKEFKKIKSKATQYVAKLLMLDYSKLSSKDKEKFDDAVYVVYMADVDWRGVEDAWVNLDHMSESFHEVFNYNEAYWKNNKFIDQLDKLTD
jgi:hypothetical protein